MTELLERIPEARTTQQIAAAERYHFRQGYESGVADMQVQIVLWCVLAVVAGYFVGRFVGWAST